MPNMFGKRRRGTDYHQVVATESDKTKISHTRPGSEDSIGQEVSPSSSKDSPATTPKSGK